MDSYRFDVQPDGTWENRKTFAHVHARLPDGKCSINSTDPRHFSFLLRNYVHQWWVTDLTVTY